MNHALVIATREVREKGRLFTMALMLAVLPFLATLVPAMRGWGRPMIIGFFGGMLGMALGLGLAIALGSTAIGRELSDRRLSFYFSKPLAPWAIWFGKAAGSIFVAFVCFAIVAIPALIASREIWGATWTISQAELVGLTALAVTVLFLVSHALSTMVRSRSAVLAIDLALLIGTGFALVSLAKPLLQGHAVRLLERVGLTVGIALTIVLAAAPVWQLARGRADVRRSHASLSRFVWIGFAVVLLCATAFVAWVVTPSASDITSGSIVQGAGGRWLFAEGTAPHRADYRAALLVDAKSGKSHRMPYPWMGPIFTRNGQRAFFALAPSDSPWALHQLTLHVADLADGSAKLRETQIAATRDVAVSADGSRVATIGNGTISVHDLDRDALLVSARGLSNRAVYAVVFLTPDLLRIWQYSDAAAKRVTIFELDVVRKSLTKTGEAEADVRYHGLAANADGSRVLLCERGLVIDGRTGATLQRVPASSRMGSAFLADGTMVVVEHAKGIVHLSDAAGHVRQVSIRPSLYAHVAAEIDGKRVAITTNDDQRVMSTYVVDVQRGVIERELRGYGVSTSWYGIEPRLTRVDGDAKLAVYARNDGIKLWDLRSGATSGL